MNAQRDVYGDMVSEARVAAEVIVALPNTIVDGEELWEITRNVEAAAPGFPIEYQGKLRTWARRLDALLPSPAPRTLAEMTPAEREATQWMQCEVAETENHYGGRGVILYPGDAGRATNVISEDGGWWLGIAMEAVTPLPDMPRMVWPDEHRPATDAEETPEPAQPRPEDVPEGEVWLIRPHENADPVPAFRVHASKYGPGKRWAHYRIGGSMLGFCDDEEVTLVSRLAQEGDV